MRKQQQQEAKTSTSEIWCSDSLLCVRGRTQKSQGQGRLIPAKEGRLGRSTSRRTALTCRDEGGCAGRWAFQAGQLRASGKARCGQAGTSAATDVPAHSQNHSLRANVQNQPGQRPAGDLPPAGAASRVGFGPGCCRGLGDEGEGRLSGKTVPRPQSHCSPRVLDFWVTWVLDFRGAGPGLPGRRSWTSGSVPFPPD